MIAICFNYFKTIISTCVFIIPTTLLSCDGVHFTISNTKQTSAVISAHHDQEHAGSIEFTYGNALKNKPCKINALHVEPFFRQKGIGKSLLKKCLKNIRNQRPSESILITANPEIGRIDQLFAELEGSEVPPYLLLPDLVAFYQRHGAHIIVDKSPICVEMKFKPHAPKKKVLYVLNAKGIIPSH